MDRREFLAASAAIAVTGSAVAAVSTRGHRGPVGPAGTWCPTGHRGPIGPPGPSTLYQATAYGPDNHHVVVRVFGVAAHSTDDADFPAEPHSLVIEATCGNSTVVDIFDLTEDQGVLHAVSKLRLLAYTGRVGKIPAPHPELLQKLMDEAVEVVDPQEIRLDTKAQVAHWVQTTTVTDII
jgi:hypothetical protein